MIPLEVAKRVNLANEIIWFTKDKVLEVNGVDGKAKIIGMIPRLPITLGNRIITSIVGIIDQGKFDILLGNGTTSEF